MKRLASLANLLVFLALLAPFTTAQSDWQRDKLVGSVRSIQVEFTEADAVDAKLVEIKRWPHQRVTYNERGQEVERVNFNQNGTEQDRSVIRYERVRPDRHRCGCRRCRNCSSGFPRGCPRTAEVR